MALLAIRSRRLLPTLSSLVSRHLTTSTVTRSSPLPITVSSAASSVGNFQFRSFKSTPATLLSSRETNRSNWEDDKLDPDAILFEGCDYNHWLITIDFPKDPKPSAEEMVEFYVQTCAKGLNISIEEAKQKIYACSTTTYQGFQAVMTEDESERFQGLPGVVFILPDSYIDPVNKEYGGDKYINGTIIPRPPPVQYKNRRPRYDNQGGQQGNFQNQQRGPMQGDGRNYSPPQNFPQQNYGPPGHVSPPSPGGYPQAGRGSNFNYPSNGSYNAQDRRAPPPPGGMQNYGPGGRVGFGPGVRGGQGPSQGFGPAEGYGPRQGPNQGFPGSGGGYGPGQGPSPGFGHGGGGYGPGQGPSQTYGADRGYGPGQGPRQGLGPSAGGGYGQGQVPSQGFGPGAGGSYGPGQGQNQGLGPSAGGGYGQGQVPSQGIGPGAGGSYGPGQGQNQDFGPGAGGPSPVQAPNQGSGPISGGGAGGNFGLNGDFGHGNQGR